MHHKRPTLNTQLKQFKQYFRSQTTIELDDSWWMYMYSTYTKIIWTPLLFQTVSQTKPTTAMGTWDKFTESFMKKSDDIEKACIFSANSGLLYNTEEMENVSEKQIFYYNKYSLIKIILILWFDTIESEP